MRHYVIIPIEKLGVQLGLVVYVIMWSVWLGWNLNKYFFVVNLFHSYFQKENQ